MGIAVAILTLISVSFLAVAFRFFWGLTREKVDVSGGLPRLALPLAGQGQEALHRAASSEPAPVQLSKYRHERAVLPKYGPPCVMCRGAALVWVVQGDYWQGICRGCGVPFARAERAGWQRGEGNEGNVATARG